MRFHQLREFYYMDTDSFFSITPIKDQINDLKQFGKVLDISEIYQPPELYSKDNMNFFEKKILLTSRN